MRTVAIALFAAGAHGFSSATSETVSTDLAAETSTYGGGGGGGGGGSTRCPPLGNANPYYYEGDYCMDGDLVYCKYPGDYPTHTSKYCKNGCKQNQQGVADTCNPSGSDGGQGPSADSCDRYSNCYDCMQYAGTVCNWDPNHNTCRPSAQCDYTYTPALGASTYSSSENPAMNTACYTTYGQCSTGHGNQIDENTDADRCAKLQGCSDCTQTPNWYCGYNKNTGNCFSANTNDCYTNGVVCKGQPCGY